MKKIPLEVNCFMCGEKHVFLARTIEFCRAMATGAGWGATFDPDGPTYHIHCPECLKLFTADMLENATQTEEEREAERCPDTTNPPPKAP